MSNSCPAVGAEPAVVLAPEPPEFVVGAGHRQDDGVDLAAKCQVPLLPKETGATTEADADMSGESYDGEVSATASVDSRFVSRPILLGRAQVRSTAFVNGQVENFANLDAPSGASIGDAERQGRYGGLRCDPALGVHGAEFYEQEFSEAPLVGGATVLAPRLSRSCGGGDATLNENSEAPLVGGAGPGEWTPSE